VAAHVLTSNRADQARRARVPAVVLVPRIASGARARVLVEMFCCDECRVKCSSSARVPRCDCSLVSFAEQARSFVERLLVVDSEARMTIAQALEHPWLALGGAGDPAREAQ
jgi:hypothetical protein